MLVSNPEPVTIEPGTTKKWTLPALKTQFEYQPINVVKVSGGHPIIDFITFTVEGSPKEIKATYSNSDSPNAHVYANMTASFKFKLRDGNW